LLDAAEALFAEKGFADASVREITQRAGANVAAIGYHFGAKEDLFQAVCVRRLRPLNARRLALLEAALARAAGRPPELADLLDAFARPFIEESLTPEVQTQQLQVLIVRLFIATDAVVLPVYEKELFPVGRRFGMAIAQALPGLPLPHLFSGIVFFAGAMVNAINATGTRFQSALPPGIAGPPDAEAILHRLIAFGVAGFDHLRTLPARPPTRPAPTG
jgi:AcrR family transcriptional regulator